MTIEVSNETFHDLLPAEMQAAKSVSTQALPEYTL